MRNIRLLIELVMNLGHRNSPRNKQDAEGHSGEKLCPSRRQRCYVERHHTDQSVLQCDPFSSLTFNIAAIDAAQVIVLCSKQTKLYIHANNDMFLLSKSRQEHQDTFHDLNN
jgi:hypothetical protein